MAFVSLSISLIQTKFAGSGGAVGNKESLVPEM